MRLLAVQFAISIALVLLALAAVEAYLRLTIPGSSRESIYEYTLSTKRYKVMKPNARVVAWGKELRTNELGFRDATPRLAPKRPGEFRIVVLGDSFTVSAGVDFSRIYTTLLEQRLKEKHPGARVINLAVGGYNVVQYAAVLEEVALGLDPDMVVVALYPENDFSMDTYEENFRIASGDTAAADVPWVQSLYTYRAYLGKVVNRFGRKEAPKADRAKVGTRTSARCARSPAPPKSMGCRSPSSRCRAPGRSPRSGPFSSASRPSARAFLTRAASCSSSRSSPRASTRRRCA